jgi:hypothetical protein
MNYLSAQDFSSFPPPSESSSLEHFIKSLPEKAIARLSQPDSDIAKLMNQYLAETLGVLPTGPFNLLVTTDRDNLAHLLASAMAYGFFP